MFMPALRGPRLKKIIKNVEWELSQEIQNLKSQIKALKQAPECEKCGCLVNPETAYFEKYIVEEITAGGFYYSPSNPPLPQHKPNKIDVIKKKYYCKLCEPKKKSHVRCVIIGENAGSELTGKEDGVVIIGDNIRNLDPSKNKNVLFIGDKIAIGETIGGKKINLKSILEKYIKNQ